MKKFLSLVVLVAATAYGAAVTQVTVVNTIAELLAKPATFDEVVLVLGDQAPFDSSVRLAKHFRTNVYPINGINVFPATNSGQWYLSALGGGASAPSTTEAIVLNCPDDDSNHEVSVGLFGSNYVLQVNQLPTVQLPSSLYIESSDSTSHKVSLGKSESSGVYSVSVGQGNSIVAPATFALVAQDTSEHIITLVTNFSGHTISVSQ